MSRPTPRARILGLAILALAAITLGVSLPAMARQIRAQNADADLPFFGMRSPDPAAIPFVNDAATFVWGVNAGTAPVTLTLVDREGAPFLRADYRGESHLVAVTGTVDTRLPGLARFRENQIKLEVITEQRPRLAATDRDAPTKTAPDRLVLAARIEREVDLAKDASPMAGVVDRKSWRYELVEFVPLGVESDRAMIVHEIAYADMPEHERTWQYAAALAVTPPTKLPKLKEPMGSNRGLDGVTWPFPLAGAGGLLLVIGVMVFGSSFVKRPADSDPRPDAGARAREEKAPSRPANA